MCQQCELNELQVQTGEVSSNCNANGNCTGQHLCHGGCKSSFVQNTTPLKSAESDSTDIQQMPSFDIKQLQTSTSDNINED